MAVHTIRKNHQQRIDAGWLFPEQHQNNAKLAVFGNADFLDDTHLQDSRYIVAVYLYLSTISWMYDTDVDMGIDSKSTVYDEISLPDANSARSLMIVFAALPVAIIIIGVGVWVKRRNS